ncbi:uncharacterized protein BDZ99DRAFT_539012 [Mytilinidion resinicola]|uniref:N-acetyltransferase domain-containing protein n=1 Tax=Mytilinidion resinicola TaxID=574789 RepID=A0A6A6YB62_9PEZI|nr:uncharacterized protein BDZ99DRAFT_539012 [Mytilinidion resinicola]KAF2805818.1 hypothetical protein BDZ99DRAFT_539012 [Mytilinidion resinicola]
MTDLTGRKPELDPTPPIPRPAEPPTTPPPSNLHYTPLRIPKSPTHLPFLAAALRTARLAALTAEPSSFATTYAAEATHPLSVWSGRLSAPEANDFAVITTPVPITPLKDEEEDAVVDLLLNSEWAGMIALRGSTPYSDYFIPESGQHVEQSGETRWHLNALYTARAHRGRGLAKVLMGTVVDYARARSGPGEKARVRLFCTEKMVGMYARAGFARVGGCTLAEAFVANGDPGGVPGDAGATEAGRGRWHTRYGVVMEVVVDAVHPLLHPVAPVRVVPRRHADPDVVVAGAVARPGVAVDGGAAERYVCRIPTADEFGGSGMKGEWRGKGCNARDLGFAVHQHADEMAGMLWARGQSCGIGGGEEEGGERP